MDSLEDFLRRGTKGTMQYKFYFPLGWRRQLFLSCTVAQGMDYPLHWRAADEGDRRSLSAEGIRSQKWINILPTRSFAWLHSVCTSLALTRSSARVELSTLVPAAQSRRRFFPGPCIIGPVVPETIDRLKACPTGDFLGVVITPGVTYIWLLSKMWAHPS